MGETEAVVHFGGIAVALSEHEELMVGRASTAHIRVGRNPIDSRVSREHVALSLSAGLVTVTRRSQTQLVIVRSASGDYSLEAPGEAVIRGGIFDVLLPKTPETGEQQPAYHRLTVAAPGPGNGPPGGSLPARPDATTARTSPLPQISARERQLLSAYARPLLMSGDQPRHAATTHRDAAAALNYGYDWVREQIDALRSRLAAEGWPVGADKDSLCRWAVAAHLITAADLASRGFDEH